MRAIPVEIAVRSDDGRVSEAAWCEFTFSTGVNARHEAAALVVNNYALDLTQPGAPMKWSFEPKPLSAAEGVACCDVVNRGAACAKGVVFFNTPDN